MNYILFLQNGLYIPFVFGSIYVLSNHFFLSSIVSLKLYSTNYFYWFNDCYSFKNIPRKYNWVKQFIRFTDTGHIASFLYYFFPSFLPVAFNVHFLITLGYWTGKVYFGMKDCDSLYDKRIIKNVENTFCSLNHSLPLMMLIYEIKLNPSYATFDLENLFYSYLWGYSWILFIYIPWVYLTNDYVYNVLYPNVPLETKVFYIFILHIFSFLSNILGYYLTLLLS
jgi:hypothetical protein